MTPDVVVDIGNSRLKWGRCQRGRVTEMVSLPLDQPQAWEQRRQNWKLPQPCRWAIATVNPPAADRFCLWVRQYGDAVHVLDDPALLPLQLGVDEPRRVGWDRLLNALAAHCLAAPEPAAVVAVGTAMTVDLIDGQGVFRGGAILPGPRLMADALHRHTALLPALDLTELPTAAAPGTNTSEAIRAGIRAALVGGAFLLVHQYAELVGPLWVFLTGGALGQLSQWDFGSRFRATRYVPTLTLEGLRIAAESLPDNLPPTPVPSSTPGPDHPPFPPVAATSDGPVG
ncbi:MAG: type III pantothenate kinase [Gemmataceae bacterium]|nr:type III pantothenate kinase [Gemmataceae bacterium]MCS7270400.1 type III pantothenate kinase [Gemmataceae bacterium]MDW8242448.1 type III pantothenate kinase [Thermogemmata sp.]